MEATDLTDTEKNMQAAGVAPDEPAYEDYYGFEERDKFYLPDGLQWIEYKQMTEGDRRRFQKATTRDIRLMRQSGDASIRVDPGEERKILFECSVTGWSVVKKRNGKFEPVPFGPHAQSGSEFDKWAQQANPKLLDGLERAIRKANPWMQAEMTVAAIDEEISNLQELRAEAVKREEGKEGSA